VKTNWVTEMRKRVHGMVHTTNTAGGISLNKESDTMQTGWLTIGEQMRDMMRAGASVAIARDDRRAEGGVLKYGGPADHMQMIDSMRDYRSQLEQAKETLETRAQKKRDDARKVADAKAQAFDALEEARKKATGGDQAP